MTGPRVQETEVSFTIPDRAGMATFVAGFTASSLRLGGFYAPADPLPMHVRTCPATATDEQEVHESIQTEHVLFVDLAERYIALYRQLPRIEPAAMPYLAQLRALLRQLGTLLATPNEEGAMPESTRDDELIARYIEPHPDKRGPDKARLKEVYVPVRTLIAYLNVVGGSVDQVAHDYEIPREAVEAVVAYYRRYQAMFDALLGFRRSITAA